MKLKPDLHRCRLLASALLALNAGTLAAATAYRWTDADGVVHYEQSPPADGRAYQTVKPEAPSVIPGAAVDDGAKAFLKRAEEDDARRAKAREAAAADKAALATQCADARKRLQFLDGNPPNRLRQREANGELRRVDATEWESQRKAAGDIIAKTCK
jgi:hypothetical protein